ncbi:MAG TPA: SBBP repeat-containing protein [Terriglobia bacterium]|nr:SBBP repeat-containing protein [Terriglobia bacterium]
MVPPAAAAPSREAVLRAYSNLPLSFAPNLGQADPQVKFIARGPGYTLFLTRDKAVMSLTKPQAGERGGTAGSAQAADARLGGPASGPRVTKSIVEFELIGANSNPALEGTDELPGKSNYLRGNDPSRWQTNVATYGAVRYHGVYPGVDMLYDGKRGDLQYDFVLAPGANPADIRIAVNSQDGDSNLPVPCARRVAANGDLVISSRAGAIRFAKPVVYQADGRGGRAHVQARYALERLTSSSGREPVVAFRLGSYDHTRPLIIDPTLSYSTYLGGSGDDEATSIAVNSLGQVYVTGLTRSADFPTTSGALQTTFGGDADVFVTELNAKGTALVYSTFIGGTGDDEGEGIVLDSAGNAYLTGVTFSSDFPGVPTGNGRSYMGAGDAFVTELNPTGSGIVYSTFLGGSGYDIGNSIALDSAGSAYITGWTASTDFPTTAGAFQTTYGGGSYDAFAAKIKPGGFVVPYSTYIGGNNWEQGYHITVDAAGDAYIAGGTESKNFPVTTGAFQTKLQAASAGFMVKLKPNGSGAYYATYLGGSGSGTQPCAACATSVAVDSSGNAYTAGLTWETNFPVTPGAYQSTFAGGYHDAFVTKLNPSGSKLVYSTYLGGSGDDGVTALLIDSSGRAYLRGNTFSRDFPTTPGAFQRVYGTMADAFFAVMNTQGTQLYYSTYLGGSGKEYCHATAGLALDRANNAYITGYTGSADFPVTPGAFQTILKGTYNAFIAKFALK